MASKIRQFKAQNVSLQLFFNIDLVLLPLGSTLVNQEQRLWGCWDCHFIPSLSPMFTYAARASML
ncbi:MAG: hypothetical protein ABW168_26375 [Sedimenticola sp.]